MKNKDEKKKRFLKEKCSSNFAVPNFFSFVKQNQPFYVIPLSNVKTKKIPSVHIKIPPLSLKYP